MRVKQRYNIMLCEAVVDDVDYMARLMGKSRSELIGDIVSDWVKQNSVRKPSADKSELKGQVQL